LLRPEESKEDIGRPHLARALAQLRVGRGLSREQARLVLIRRGSQALFFVVASNRFSVPSPPSIARTGCSERRNAALATGRGPGAPLRIGLVHFETLPCREPPAQCSWPQEATISAPRNNGCVLVIEVQDEHRRLPALVRARAARARRPRRGVSGCLVIESPLGWHTTRRCPAERRVGDLGRGWVKHPDGRGQTADPEGSRSMSRSATAVARRVVDATALTRSVAARRIPGSRWPSWHLQRAG
jgi:hypothetical protein